MGVGGITHRYQPILMATTAFSGFGAPLEDHLAVATATESVVEEAVLASSSTIMTPLPGRLKSTSRRAVDRALQLVLAMIPWIEHVPSSCVGEAMRLRLEVLRASRRSAQDVRGLALHRLSEGKICPLRKRSSAISSGVSEGQVPCAPQKMSQTGRRPLSTMCEASRRRAGRRGRGWAARRGLRAGGAGAGSTPTVGGAAAPGPALRTRGAHPRTRSRSGSAQPRPSRAPCRGSG